MTVRVAVAGAGISGLAAALRLRSLIPDVEIVVFERDDRAGGKILTDRVDGFVIEGGPDAFLASKPGGIGLSRELGLEPELVTTNPAHKRSFVLNHGALQPLPEGLSGLIPGELRPVFRSPILSPRGKARMLLDFVRPPRQSEEDESLASFVTRRVGREMYERMTEPLLAGIYAGDGERLSLAATFPQLRAFERDHGGLIKGAVAQKREAARRASPDATPRGFLSFRAGMSRLIEAAVATAAASGTCLRFGTGVTAIERDRDRFRVHALDDTSGGDNLFDGVVMAVPAWAASPLLASVAPLASEALQSIDHGSSALVAIAFPESQLRQPLDGYGYVVPRVERRDVMAMTWVSSKWQDRAPGGQVLVRGFIGRSGQEAALERDDADLTRIVLREIREVLGADVTPTLARVYRWNRGMPQYNLGHLDRVRAIETSLAAVPGVEIAGNMLRGVGIPDCIVSGQAAAARLADTLTG